MNRRAIRLRLVSVTVARVYSTLCAAERTPRWALEAPGHIGRRLGAAWCRGYSAIGLSLALVLALAMTLAAGAVAPAQAAGPQSGAIASDSASNHLYIAQPRSNAVFVLAAKDMRLLTVLDVPPTPAAIAVDPARGRVYVASDDAGMITAFDDRTFALLHIYAVGGHPSGLTLVDRGKTLLIGDSMSGATQRLAVLSPKGRLRQVFTAGGDGSSLLLLAPSTVWSGQQARVWARGFSPGEPVGVYWGWQPLVSAVANAAGIVKATFEVPRHVARDTHLIILNGRWSKVSASGLIHVIAAPRAPTIHHKRHMIRTSLLQQVMAPAVTVPVPAAVVRLYAQLTHHTTPAPAPARSSGSVHRQARVAPVRHGQPASAPHHAARVAPPAAVSGARVRVPVVLIAPEGLILLLLVVRKMLRRRKRSSKVEKGKGRSKPKAARGAAVDRAA